MVLAAVLVLLYENVIKMYLAYYRYTSQGVKCVGFPLPLIGNMNTVKDYVKDRSEFKNMPFYRMFQDVFGKDKLPPIILFFYGNRPNVFITDEKIVNDIYVKHNKYFNKNGRIKQQMRDLMGNSIIFT